MDVSDKQIRKARLKDDLSLCDNYEKAIDILLDKIIALEDSLHELELTYYEVLVSFNRLCAQTPF